MAITVRATAPTDREWIDQLIDARWGRPVVTLTGNFDPAVLHGFIAERDETGIGLVTYEIGRRGLQIVTLDSVVEKRGVGTALLQAVKHEGDRRRVRVWVTTTNENLNAIGFYQRRGMDMVEVHRDFAELVRRAKPDVPSAKDGIPFRHALEFEFHRS